MKGSRQGYFIMVIASLMTTCILIPTINAADNRGYPLNYPSLNYSLHNGTLPDGSMRKESGETPAPVTIYKFELDRKSLPGPRYMAYGPSVINLAVDPRLIVLVIGICVIIAGLCYLLPRNENDEKME